MKSTKTRTNKEMRDYYKKNKAKYRKGGAYYYYKPKAEAPYVVSIKRGTFIIDFS